MAEVAPIEVPKSAAICGSNGSEMRSENPLAKAAKAISRMATRRSFSVRASGDDTLTLDGVAGFVARPVQQTKDNDRQDLPALGGRGPHLESLGRGGCVPRRPLRARERRDLFYRHPAAERHRLAAYGPCAQQHVSGRALPLRAHARQGRVVVVGFCFCWF